MSFRTRLTSFFVLIVVIPMLAVGFLVFRLISDSQQGKADARVNGVATAAGKLYESESAAASADARTLVRALARSSVARYPPGLLRWPRSPGSLACQYAWAAVPWPTSAPVPRSPPGLPPPWCPGWVA